MILAVLLNKHLGIEVMVQVIQMVLLAQVVQIQLQLIQALKYKLIRMVMML